VLGFVGFEQAPVLSEEARHARRTILAATYAAIIVIGVVYAGSSWAMAAHAGTSGVVAAARQRGPGLLFGLGGGALGQAAQLLFMTSLFAAALSFHNCLVRYEFSLGREHVLPAALGRTARNNIPRAASLAQSVTAGLVIVAYAEGGWDPMTHLFFWWGGTGGFGVLVLLTATALAVITFFARDHRGENLWQRLIAPGAALLLLAAIVVLAVQHYALLLGVSAGSPAAWILPVSYAVAAGIGLGWGLILKYRRPRIYQAIGLGPAATASQVTLVPEEAA
jgi:amino acid transporter